MTLKKRNFGLDLLRAISIVLVLIAHKVRLPVELGVLGVQVFFILSGFLIGQILLKDFENKNSFATVLHFWKRRWFRTLPLYYLVLTCMLFFNTNPFGWKVLVYYFFLQANFVGIDFFPVTWSLVVEEWFYIFLPIACLAFFANGIKPKSFLISIVFFIFFFFCARFFWNYFEKGVIIYQFDCLLLGVVLATLKKHFNSAYAKLACWPLALLGLVGVFYLVILMGNLGEHAIHASFYKVSWYFLVSLCIAFVLPFLELSKFINNNISRIRPIYNLITWISVLSYSLYLLHPAFYTIHLDLPIVLLNFIQFFLLLSLCLFLYILYERPVMSLRDGFSFRNYMNSLKSALRGI